MTLQLENIDLEMSEVMQQSLDRDKVKSLTFQRQQIEKKLDTLQTQWLDLVE